MRKKSEAGFTLVEMLVSLSLFAVVVTMAVSTLLILIDANGRAQSMQLVMTNLTFALDSMTREIRTGYNWYCDDSGTEPSAPDEDDSLDCPFNNSGNYISIIESGDSLTGDVTVGVNRNRITYWFDETNHMIMRKLGDNDPSHGWTPLTGSEISIDDVRIVVTDTDRQQSDGDTTQPTATIYIKGRAGLTAAEGGDSPQVREFSIQTTVTQRLLDI